MDMNLPQHLALDERAVGERDVMERASVSGQAVREPVVNPAHWARQVLTQQDCQKQADTKAFTGRGKLRELRQLLTELDTVARAMRHLAELTLQVQDGQMRLVLHIKKSTGLTFLRWREKTGSCRHIPWPEIGHRIGDLPPEVGDWYRRASTQAVALNERHKELRRAIATARKVLMSKEQQVFARPVNWA